MTSQASAMAARRETKILLQHSQYRHRGELWHIVLMHNGDHDSVNRMLMGLSWKLYCWRQSDWVLEQWQTTGRQKGTEFHHQGEFLHIIHDKKLLHTHNCLYFNNSWEFNPLYCVIVPYFMHVADWLIGRTLNAQWMEKGGTLSLQKGSETLLAKIDR